MRVDDGEKMVRKKSELRQKRKGPDGIDGIAAHAGEEQTSIIIQ